MKKGKKKIFTPDEYIRFVTEFNRFVSHKRKLFSKIKFKKTEFLSVLLFIISFSTLFAEIRIKTVEYNFGGYYNATDLASGTQFNFPARFIKLPENGKTIRSAWLEYNGMATSATNVNPLVIYFDAAATPSTAKFTSGQYTTQTGESIILSARADVTSVINSQIANLATGVTFSAGIKITGPASNGHTMKLYITYEYDDQSPTQVKTVRFPLYSDYTNKIAAFTTQQAAGTRSMQYLADISENVGFKIQQQWFEITGFEQNPNSTTDSSFYLNIGGINEPTMTLDASQKDSYYFRYLSSSTIVPGFSTGTLQTVNLVYTNNAINMLCGEVVITYEFSLTSTQKMNVVREYFGHYTSSNVATSKYFQIPLYLREEGITLKEVYFKIAGSYDSTTSGNITLASNIGSQSVTSRSYAAVVTQAQISGYEFFHSLTPAISGWTNGAIVGTTITVTASAGAQGMELIAVYSYTNDAAHTTNYGVFSGNSTAGTSTSYAYTSPAYWVESGSSKTLNSAYVYSNIINNTATGDFLTTINFGGNSPLITANKTTTEAATISRYYQNNSQVFVGTTAFTPVYSIGTTAGTFTGQSYIKYIYIPPPKIPQSLAQYKINGQSIGLGEWINSPAVRFEGILSSSMNVDNLALVVEVKPNSSSFDGLNLSTGGFFSYSGTALSTSVIVTGLTSGTIYKWRAAGLGLGNRGLWSEFTAPAFGVDLSSPTAPAMVSIAPVDASAQNYTSVSFSFESVTDTGGSGLKNYELWLATSADFATLVFSSQPISNSAYVSGLAENTYYWKVRVYDNAGNIGDWSAVRSFIVDLTVPSITDNQSDDIWRNSNSGFYNVDFEDLGGSLLDKFQVKATSGPNQTGILYADWTDIVTNINSQSYVSDWSLPQSVWELLAEGTGYISVRVYDKAGNGYTKSDVFKVFKDTTPPTYTNGEEGGDLIWLKIGRLYDVDFEDKSSELAGAKYAARTGPNFSGVLKISSTSISGVSGANWTTDWGVDFDSLEDSATNYISIEIYDIAGNTTTIVDAFIIKKDTTPPVYTNGEEGGDLIWRKEGRNYNVDFSDNGSKLAGAKYAARTGPNFGGVLKITSTSISGVSGANWTTDWGVDFDSLEDSAANYISIEIYDIAGNTTTIVDAFVIKKDTTPPAVYDYQSGDDIWRNSAGTVYNVDFVDNGSKLNGAKYEVWTGAGRSGVNKIALTDIPGVTGQSYTQDWSVDFDSLNSGDTNYVSVEVYDIAGNVSISTDVFYVLKDTVSPYIAISTPLGGYSYVNDPGAVVDIDVFDDISGLDKFEYKISTGPNYSGDIIKNWTVVADLNGEKSYISNWGIDFYSLPINVVTYISLKVYDIAGNIYEYPDVTTYIRQAPPGPAILDNQEGDNVWRKENSGIYNVDFISYAELNITTIAVSGYTQPNFGGEQIFDYTDILYPNTSSYISNWALTAGMWDLLKPGTNYISVKAWDVNGSTGELKDAFYVLKDTQPPAGQIISPLYVNSFSFPVEYSASDSVDGIGHVELYYTYDTNSPYTWLKYGSGWTSSPINFSATQWGTVGFRLIIYDSAGNQDELYDPPQSSTAPEFYTLIDSTYPAVLDNQEGDYLWRNTGGTLYDVDFSANGGSPLDSAYYRVYSSSNCGGSILKDWTLIASNINNTNYTANWGVDFDSLNSGVNYIANRVSNLAGNTTYYCDVFFVRKDQITPSVINYQSGDYVWRNSNNGFYNVDFQDNESLISKFQIKATTGPNQTGTMAFDWTDLVTDINSSNYQVDWQLTNGLWNLLLSGTNYISVKVYDNAGNVRISTDVFYVLKDTQAPTITDNQEGDDIWRNSNNALYNVSFQDNGKSLLKEVKVKIYSQQGQTGSLISDWATVISDINSLSYSTPWGLTEQLSELLPQGTSYVSVRVYDNAGNYSERIDAFYILKDTQAPTITDNQQGDNIWRNSNSGVYDIDFNDTMSGLKGFEVKITTGPNQTGTLIADWTVIATELNTQVYINNWGLSSPLWELLPSGTNYVSVRSSDVAGNYSILTDAFYVRKDTQPPSITDNQGNETVWHNANVNSYDVNFADSLGGIFKFQLKVTSGTNGTGALYADWTDNVTNINSNSYTIDWNIDSGIWDLIASGTSYVSVRVFDLAGNSSTTIDAFKLLKDTVPPNAIANLSAQTPSNEGEITVSFTAPFDIGELNNYIVKYATYSIDDGNFSAAEEFSQSIQPAAQGGAENFNITGLTANTLYYIAIKTVDKAGNVSAISNTASATSGPDTTAPAAISDLAAEPGATQGQINLSWTAVGDNVNIGTATAYQLRYRTDSAITNATLWDSATVYIQNWQPKPAGEIENQVLSGLNPGTTYYFAIKAVDEANNISGLSNSPSAWAQMPGAREGILIYQSGTNNTPYYKKWLAGSFGGQGTTPATNASPSSNIRHIIIKSSPLRNEKIAGILSDDGVLQVQRYDGATGVWTNEWSTTTIGATNSAYRGFDIAYEQESGRAMVLYNGAAAGQLYYNIYDGNSWTGALTLTTGTAYAALWVRLEAKPNSDEIMAAFSKATSLELYAIRWDGNQWTNGQQIRNGVGITTKQDWDIAWESLGGEALVVYNSGTAGRADTYKWNGLNWSPFNANYFAFGGSDGTAQWIRLASDPNSDYIGATSVDSGSDWNASIWDGSGWSYQATENGNVRNNANQSRTIDAAWESKSSKLVIVSGQGGLNNNIIYATFTPTTGWGVSLAAAPTFGAWSNRVYGVRLENDPNTNTLLLTGWDVASGLRTAVWNGSSFVFNPAGTHTTSLSQYNYMPAMIAIDRHDDIPPTVVDNQSGDDIWRNSDDAVYNIDAQDTGGSHLKGIQTKIFTSANQSGYLLEDWTYQVSTGTVDNYIQNWGLVAGTWEKLREGINYVSVRAVDNAGNYSAIITDAFYIKKDTTPPSLPAIIKPADKSYSKIQNIYFDWSNSQDLTSGIYGYEILVSTDENFSSISYSNSVSISESTSTALSSGKYYWKVRALDNAGNYSNWSSSYSVIVDTIAPVVKNYQSGDNNWRKVSGTFYNVDFEDNELIESIEYTAYSGENYSGLPIIGWSIITSTPVNQPSYTADWEVNFNLLAQGTNYISVRVWDRAGSTVSVADVFYVKKDTTAPSITDNQQGDDIWRNSNSGIYDIDLNDAMSGVKGFEIKITTGPNQTGTLIADWTVIATELNTQVYTNNWGLSSQLWELLPSGTNYVSVRSSDTAGNYSILTDAFYIKKDTVPPLAPVLSYPADKSYKNVQNVYLDWNESFDILSGINGYEILVSTDENFSVYSYSNFVDVSETTTTALSEGKYYWKVRAKDNAGNYSVFTGTYSVVIDTTPPAITDNQSGDDNWQKVSGTFYNVDFEDNYGLSAIKYEGWTGANKTGNNVLTLRDIATVNGQTNWTADWEVDFNLLEQGLNYISVKAIDVAGNSSNLNDVFYVKKDIVAPSIIDNQAGDNVWRAINNGTYDVDFFDASSMLKDVEIKIATGPNYSGNIVLDWTYLFTNMNTDSFTENWSINSTVWDALELTTNYVSLRVSDNAGNIAVSTDVFYIKKDTNPVNIIDNQAGDNIWRNSNTGIYNIDAYSPNSPVDKLEVKVSTRPSYEGIFLINWTTAVININSNNFETDWTLPDEVFNAMISGVTNYVSVRFTNQAGLYNESMDVFYVLKDTAPPIEPLAYSPPDKSSTNVLAVSFDWQDIQDYGSGIDYYQIMVSTDVSFNVYSASGDYINSEAVINLPSENLYYWKLKSKDKANNYSVWSSTNSVLVDTTVPNIIDNQSGDDVWRNTNSGFYNVDFEDLGGSLLSKVQVRASTNTGTVGPFYPDWSDNIVNINLSSYSNDWQIAEPIWSVLQSGTNHISIRVYDNAGNVYTYPNQPFYIKKDTVTPSVPALISPVNNGSVNSLSVSFDWNDSTDLHSGISQYHLMISTSENFEVFTASGDYSVSSANIAFSNEGKYYWKVKAKDIAGNYSVYSDTYSVIVDTTSPLIYNYQSGDNVWRNQNDAVYNVDFIDDGGSLLIKFQVKATTGPNQTGIVAFDWTDLVTDINSSNYQVGWQLTNGLWNLLLSGTNYISVRVYDNAGNYSILENAFYVLKDTTPVTIVDNQSGDENWQSVSGTFYNIDFQDFDSKISSAAYTVWTGANKTGTQMIISSQIFNSVSGIESYTSNWLVDFNNLAQGLNYVSVSAWDIAGNTTEYIDAFYVKKDTENPIITDLQSGDTNWYRLNPGNIFNVDFADNGIGISTISIEAWTQSDKSGQNILTSTAVWMGSPVASYTDNWGLTDAQWNLLVQNTNYITVTAYDDLGHSSTVIDAFYILKDTTPPANINNFTALTPSAAQDEGKIIIRWNAVGDDGLLNNASYYLIRYRNYNDGEVNESNFDTSNVYISTLVPKSPGEIESLIMENFQAGSTYYFRIKVIDKAGNAVLSNSTSTYAGVDKTPPGAITDLVADYGDFTGQILLSWTARGEGTAGVEGTSAAYSYIVKYATFAINEANFYNSNVSTYTQNWSPLAYGQNEIRIMEGLVPGATYSIAIKVIDEVGNISAISNVVIGTATPAGAADGLIVYSENGANNFKYRTWSPITWSSQLDSGLGSAAKANWMVLKAVPIVANVRMAGISYSDNSLKFFKYDGLAGSWTDITPTPVPSIVSSNYRNFDIAVENNTGRIMVVYYNNTTGAVSYAIYSATASAWVVNPTGLSMASLTGVVNWVRLKSMPGSNRIALAVLDANSDISAAIWNGLGWIDNANLTTSASIATRESFDIAWETLSGDLMAFWGTGTTTNYRKWYSTSTWASTLTGPNPAATVNWVRLASDPLSNRIGASYLYGTTSWNAAIWRSAGTETWSASTADTTISGMTGRMTDCAWQSKTAKFIAVAVDEIGTIDNKFKTAIWTAGSWTATPSAGAVNNNTVFAGSITWISLLPDPNTDNITALGLDAAYDIRSTVWSGTAWADAGSSANFLHQSNSQNFLYEAVAMDFDRHDNIPPTVVDNQSGDDSWRNSNYATYNIQATDSGGSKLARIQTKIYSSPNSGGSLIEDWTDQVSAINLDSYSTPWKLTDATFNKLYQGQNYVSVRAIDGAGNISNIEQDAFYIRKDTTPPQVTSLLAENSFNFWTSTGVGEINIDFTDSGGSQISSITYSAWTGPNKTGSKVFEDILIASGSIGNSYTANWNINFEMLAHGTNYITVTVWDNALSSATKIDAFKVLKDTQPPSVISNLSAAPGPVRGSVLLSWTAPGDDGTVNRNLQGGYIVKYATFAILTEQLFNSASAYMQNWIPADAGTIENNVVYELDADTTYYFAIKTYDKANNITAISNSTNTLPQKSNVFINEIYAGGSAGSDWIELYNNTEQNFNLNGWKIIYKQGALDSQAAEVELWTGNTEVINSSSILKISIATDLNSAQSYSVILKNNLGKIIDKVQWLAMSSSESFARVYDGSQLFEIDPTPTPGFLNSISTYPVKISEVSYSNWQFVELYNTGNDTITLSGFVLRNSFGEKFKFTRKIYPQTYIILDISSISNDGYDWYNAFGINGLKANGDYLVLEDSSGQVLDRVIWQSGSYYSVYDYKTQLTSAGNFAPANSNTSIIRRNGEGIDTDNDSSDFGISNLVTPFSRNIDYGSGLANTLVYPSTNSVLPTNFALKVQLGENYTTGNNDILAFIRIGGDNDNKSPHIYRLADIGFSLSNLTEQTTTHTYNDFIDIDGNKLIDGAVYKVILTADNTTTSAPQIIISSITVDLSTHNITADSSSMKWLNENGYGGVLKLKIENKSSNYNLVLASVALTLFDENEIPLTSAQASDRFESIFVAKDSVLGSTGVYEVAIDSSIIAEVLNENFNLDGQGRQIIPINISDFNSVISKGESVEYFIVLKSSTNSASYKFIAKLEPELSVIKDKQVYLAQNFDYSAAVKTSTITIITPAKAPAGTSWPYSTGKFFNIESMVGVYNNGIVSNRVYIGAMDGILRTVDYTGTEKWSFATSPLSAIRNSPLISEESSSVYLYFATDNGDVYKVKDNGNSYTQQWQTNISTTIKGNILDTETKLYFGTPNNKIYCLNKADGNYCSGWPINVDAAISGTISLDDRVDINTGWVGLENGKVLSFRLSDGYIFNQFITGGPIYSSPYIDSAYSKGSNNLYITSTDGKLYARTAANLTTYPPYWTDYTANSQIKSSPWVTFDEEPNKYVFFGDESGKLYKVSATSGTLADQGWIYDAGAPISFAPIVWDYVYFAAGECLYVLNPVTGALRNNFPVCVDGYIKGDLVLDLDNKYLIFSASEGRTYVIDVQ